MNKVLKGVAIAALVVVAWIGIALTTGTNRVRANNFTVTNLDDSGDGSLRQAILDANANPGADTIVFQDELSGTITLTSGELLITDDVTINGPGIFSIIVSGNNSSRVFEVGSAVTVTISGLTISNGGITTDNGAGIKNSGVKLTLTNVVLSGNSATSNTVGGGIFNSLGSALEITGSTLSSNSVSLGGGGGINNQGTLTITGSTLSGNSSGFGGGLLTGGTSTVLNCTFSGNSSTLANSGGGGGIANTGTLNVSFTTLSGNSDIGGHGGGLFNLSGTTNIKNSIVANSTSGGDCFSAGGAINATGTNFTTDGTCPGFTQVTSAQLNLGPLADNGGNTQTHALRPGSVAIDAAPDCTDLGGQGQSPKIAGPKATVTTDQRGVGRPQGSACDVGSYEFVPCLTTPTVVCPESFSPSTDATHCSAVVDFTAVGNCPCENGGGKPSASKTVGVKPPVSPSQGCMVSCAPASGSTFPRGTTTVTCTASDSFGNTSQPCSFTVTVTDQTPPAVTCPANIVKSTDPNQCSTTASYTVTANDNCDGPVTATCAPQSGSTFPKGVTTVTCTATDSSNNTGSCSFTVTVNDTQPPSITCPANVTRDAGPNQCSSTVTYPPPTVSDNCPNVGAPVCSPASGSTFPGGTTTVTCTVSDGSNNTASCSFTVTIRDTQPPTITCPANITFVTAASCPPASGMPANFTVTASDNCSGVSVVCRNQNGVVVTSGQPFPVGTTTVTCTATDTSGNTASCSFTVSGFNFCLQDDANPGNVVLINALTGEYRFCCGGVVVASGAGTLTTRGCIGTIDELKGARRAHIEWDTSANGTGVGTAIIQVSPNKTICQIRDSRMTDDTCSCGNAPPAGKSN